eukprot:scaffold4880_cov173-Skeletonema_dohrnii-CCMP3373.AAC.11
MCQHFMYFSTTQPKMPFRNKYYHRCAREGGTTERRRGGHRCTHLSRKSAPEEGGGARRRTLALSVIQRNNSADVTKVKERHHVEMLQLLEMLHQLRT